jgi:H+/Cl- antiporter ClcA
MTIATQPCANHPGRQTSLRCNRCDKPICSQCAMQTPVGYRCRECVRGQQAVFDTAQSRDYWIAGVVSAILVGIGTALLGVLGFWSLIISPVAGGGVGEAVRWAVKRRRSRRLPLAAAIGGVLGVAANLGIPLITFAVIGPIELETIFQILPGFLWPVVTGAIMVGSLYYRLRGIRL